jgi:lysyl-tRNA synthetase class 1
VFEREPPINVAYEFLNIGGKKMSTSKGRGAAAHSIADVVPAEQLRFLFVRPRPNQAIEFDPEGTDSIPRLVDEFDRLAQATAGREVKGDLPAGYESVFRYSLVDPAADVAAEAAAYRPPFGHLALLVQVPGVDVRARVEAEKGTPLTGRELDILSARVESARRWLQDFAPERARIVVRRDALPNEATAMDDVQQAYLGRLADQVEREQPTTGDQWQAAIFSVASEASIDARQAFTALYLAFLGRTNGPRAGWLLASLDAEFVRARLREAAGAVGTAA